TRPKRDRGAVRPRARLGRRPPRELASLLDSWPVRREPLRSRDRRPHSGVDRGGTRAWTAPRLAPPPTAFRALDAAGDEVDELRGQHGRRDRVEGGRGRQRAL